MITIHNANEINGKNTHTQIWLAGNKQTAFSPWGSLPLEAVPHPSEKKKNVEKRYVFQGGRGTRVTRKGCQNYEHLDKRVYI